MTISSYPVNNYDTYKQDVCKGLVSGVSYWAAHGERQGVGTTVNGEDIWRGAAVSIPVPDPAGEQLTAVSTSQADNGTSATGALTVRIYYLDPSFNQQEETITIDGTTPVDLVASDIAYVNDMNVQAVGSNGVAVGDISLYMQGDSARIYSWIDAGGNQSLASNRMVPAGKSLCVMGWNASEAQGKRNAVRIRSTDYNGEIRPGVFLFKGASYLNASTTGQLDVIVHVPPLSVIKFTTWATVNGGEVAVNWWGYLYD